MKITGRREQMLARTAVIGKYLLMPGDITVEAMMVLSNDPTYWHNWLQGRYQWHAGLCGDQRNDGG